MTFVNSVRRGRVAQPTQRHFDRSDWEASFNQSVDKSLEDERVFTAGLWTYERLELAREALTQEKLLGYRGDKFIRCLVGAVNREYLVASHLRGSEVERLASGEGEERHIDLRDLSDLTVGRMEGVVDAARYALAAAQNKTFAAPPPDKGRIVEMVYRALRLSAYYDAVENIWAECLWNGWYVENKAAEDIVRPADIALEIDRATGAFRREMLLVEIGFRALDMWRTQARTVRDRLGSRLRIVDVERTGSGKRITVGPHIDDNTPPVTLSSRLAAEQLYFREALFEPLPRLNGVTADELIQSWEVLAPLGEMIEANFPESTAISAAGTLEQFAPKFRRSDLAAALSKAMTERPDRAKLLLDILTFGGTPREELWQHPFVPTPDGMLIPIVPALVYPNLVRSIEHWWRIGGVDVSRRGSPYEQHVRERMAKSDAISDLRVIETPITVSISGVDEEVDFVAVIDDTILVGEIKCSSYPTEPLEMHNYFETLSKAAEQARRKSEWVRGNVRPLLDRIGAGVEHKEITIVPLVITNIPVGAGRVIRGISVVDDIILERYLSEGTIAQGRWDKTGIAKEVVGRLYQSDREAAVNLPAYLANPPQVTQYRDRVAAGSWRLEPVGNERSAIVLHFSATT